MCMLLYVVGAALCGRRVEEARPTRSSNGTRGWGGGGRGWLLVSIFSESLGALCSVLVLGMESRWGTLQCPRARARHLSRTFISFRRPNERARCGTRVILGAFGLNEHARYGRADSILAELS